MKINIITFCYKTDSIDFLFSCSFGYFDSFVSESSSSYAFCCYALSLYKYSIRPSILLTKRRMNVVYLETVVCHTLSLTHSCSAPYAKMVIENCMATTICIYILCVLAAVPFILKMFESCYVSMCEETVAKKRKEANNSDEMRTVKRYNNIVGIDVVSANRHTNSPQ